MRDKAIEGISDLRDESDRDGMRIVIELKRGEVPEVVLNNLYRHTQLQTTFGIIMLAIARGRPKVLNLLEFIEEFIEFRREVVRRRTEFELRKAEARAHILEGLRIALDHLDQVIAIIRGSKTTGEARDGLIAGLSLSQLQAQAILEMQLQRLTGLERQKIVDELADLLKLIEQLRAILASDILLMQVVVDELKAVREKYGDERRTVIVEAEGEFRVEDLIADEDVAITVTATGYIKRTAIKEYRSHTRQRVSPVLRSYMLRPNVRKWTGSSLFQNTVGMPRSRHQSMMPSSSGSNFAIAPARAGPFRARRTRRGVTPAGTSRARRASRRG